MADWDVIVIGGGLGGLTAGALLARGGARVLLLERGGQLGGAATLYRHGKLTIEASLHEMDGFDADDPKMPLLDALGIGSELDLVDIGALHEVRSAAIGEPLVIPHGVQPAIAALSTRFPDQAGGIVAYYDRLVAIRRAVGLAARHQNDRGWWLRNAPMVPFKLWPLIRDRNATVAGVLDRLFGTAEGPKLAVGANLGYYDDDPARMLFLAFAVPQASYAIGGGHYPRGGSARLSARLAEILATAGGQALTGREAVAIRTAGGRVAGVAHRGTGSTEAPEEETAPLVLGNAAPHALAAMLPEADRAAYAAAFLDRPVSVSLFNITLGFSRPPAAFGVRCWSTVLLPDWMRRLADMPEAAPLLGAEPAARMPPVLFVDYAQRDTGLNQEGLSLGALTGIDRLSNWQGLEPAAARARREAWMDRLIALLDREFPGIAGAVAQREMATAETMHRYLGTPGGAVYGFRPYAEAGGLLTRGPATPVPGLLHASAFTGSGGYTGAMIGGAMAAGMARRTRA